MCRREGRLRGLGGPFIMFELEVVVRNLVFLQWDFGLWQKRTSEKWKYQLEVTSRNLKFDKKVKSDQYWRNKKNKKIKNLIFFEFWVCSAKLFVHSTLLLAVIRDVSRHVGGTLDPIPSHISQNWLNSGHYRSLSKLMGHPLSPTTHSTTNSLDHQPLTLPLTHSITNHSLYHQPLTLPLTHSTTKSLYH